MGHLRKLVAMPRSWGRPIIRISGMICIKLWLETRVIFRESEYLDD